MHGAVARHYCPEDMRIGTLAGAQDQLDRGATTLGMAIRGRQLSTPETALADFRAAAERGLVVSMRQSGGEPGKARVC